MNGYCWKERTTGTLFNMNNAYEEFAAGSQSPFNVGRGAHPGAVLLSPQSSGMKLSNSVTSGGGILSPQVSAHSHSLSFNDMLDQQSLLSDGNVQQQAQQTQQHPPTMAQPTAIPSSHSAAGSAVLSPLVQSPTRTPATTSMFLDAFPRQSSNTLMGVQSRNHSSHKPQSQPQLPSQTQQQAHPDSNPVVNFTQDINQLCSWMSMLSSSQQNTVMDNLLSTLNENVLQYTKLKLDSLMNSGYLSPQIPAIASPVPNSENYAITNLDSVFSNGQQDSNDPDGNNMDSMMSNSIIYQQWSPQPTSMTQPIYDYIKDMHQRPKSADPNVSRNNSNQKNKRPPHGTSNSTVNSNPTHNHAAHNNHYTPSKSRTSLNDYDGNTSGNNGAHSVYTMRQPNNYRHDHSHLHGNGHSHSLGQVYNQGHVSVNVSNPQSEESLPELPSNSIANASSASSTTAPIANGNSNAINGSSMNPRTLTDPRLLTNIPVWLKSLRLHKYSDALSHKKWDELIYLDDEMLEKIGISALGARRKLLKAFAIVQEYKEQGLIDQSAYT